MNAASAASSSRYDQQISVVDGLRRAFEKFKHHQCFTRRVKPIIEKELPGFTVAVSPCEGPVSLASVRVWGLGIGFGNAVTLCWHDKVWQTGFARELQRCDVRDYEEREQDEQLLQGLLDQMEKEVAALRGKAEDLIKKLPIPKSATIRAESVFWELPSSKLRKRCPLLFGHVEGG
jgi:hypothetical protein